MVKNSNIAHIITLLISTNNNDDDDNVAVFHDINCAYSNIDKKNNNAIINNSLSIYIYKYLKLYI